MSLENWSSDQLFDFIFSLQAVDNPAYPNGLFPSIRWHPFGYNRLDNSAYFSAGLLFNLLRLKPLLTPSQIEKVEQHIDALRPVFDLYQNKAGRNTYNFWQTKPPGHFSNGRLLGCWEYFRPPDDADDSVMIYQVLNKPPTDWKWLLAFMDEHANGKKRQVKHFPSKYTSLKAWTTFFVRDMPPGFDACVISNLVGFALQSGFPLSVHALEGIRFLELVFESDDWSRHPNVVAPYYPFPFVIAYHASRLVHDFPANQHLQTLRQVLTEKLSVSAPQTGFQAVLQFVACRNVVLPASFPTGLFAQQLVKSPFFVLPLSQEFHGLWAKWLARQRITHLRFSCPAFNLTLALEAKLLQENC